MVVSCRCAGHGMGILCHAAASKALQAMLLLDFTLFGLPASLFMQLEMLAGSPLLPAMLALGGMVALLVGAITRDLAAAVFVGLLVLCILSGRNLLGQDGGHHLVLGLGFVVAVCDIAAYFVGRRVGGPRLAPAISPNKTLSGAAGGMFAAVIGSVMLLHWWMPVLRPVSHLPLPCVRGL